MNHDGGAFVLPGYQIKKRPDQVPNFSLAINRQVQRDVPRVEAVINSTGKKGSI